jgi:quercetin dioxygenase-like cupin family protein
MIPRGASTKGPAEMFMGEVYFDVIAKGEEPSRMRVNTARFAPRAPTAWRTHARGQTLHVTREPGTVWGEHVTDAEYTYPDALGGTTP